LKEAQKVFAIAVIMGVSMWVIDAFVDAYIFYETSFVNSLIFYSAHELYFRLFFLIGCVIFGAVISRFVAKTKKAEEKSQNALAEVKEEKLRTEGILAAIADAISIQDVDFRILYQNQAHINLTGNHTGEYCYRAYRGKDHVCENCHLSLSFRDGKIYTNEQSRPTDNGTYYYEIKSSPLKNSKGEIIAGIEAVRDITQRKRTEELIKQSKKDWESTFDTIEDMITIHDKDFNIIRANRAAQKLHELTARKRRRQTAPAVNP
jgi:PAS domain S-box-containing protein